MTSTSPGSLRSTLIGGVAALTLFLAPGRAGAQMTTTRVEDFKLEDWLPYWISPNDMIALLAALAVLVAFLAIWQALRAPDPFQRRFVQVAQRKEGLRQEVLQTQSRRQRVSAAGAMSNVVTRLNLVRSQRAQDARMLLAQAGIRTNEGMIRYLFA